jgi:hypothetical protein
MNLLRTISRGARAPSRRALLKALGVSAAASPLIPALDGWAAPAARRLLLVFSPHGVIPELYWPSGADPLTLPPGGILEPLAPHKADLLIFKGLKRPVAGKSGLHEVAMGNLWTGNTTMGEDAGAASIDQIIAKALAPKTDFATLQFGVQCAYGGEGDITAKAGSPLTSGIYAGPRQRIYAECDPVKMYERVFGAAGAGGTPGDAAALERARREKKSLIDFVSGEILAIQPRISKDDRLKLDAHLEATRDIERRLTTPAKTCGGITRPDGTLDLAKGANLPPLIQLMNKLLVASLACDRARIASMQYTRAFSFHKYTWVNSTVGHHDLSHKANDRKIADVARWYMEQLADLIVQLKAVPEGPGTLFDSLLFVWGSEVFTGWDHAAGPSPVFFAGNGGGAIAKTGRMVDFGGQHDHNQLLTTICHAMGVTTVNKVGDLGSEGVLPGILA